jgi:hypothetical protein
MPWRFHDETKIGAESALDACDYFVDEVIEPWKILGEVKLAVQAQNKRSLLNLDVSIFHLNCLLIASFVLVLCFRFP